MGLIDPKLIRNDHDIHDAVKLWCADKYIIKRLWFGKGAAEKKYGHISDWDVSNVTNMKILFKKCSYFNDDISKWDVSNVTNMEGMFSCARVFNQDIGRWDVSNVISMYYMFACARVFNQDIGRWDVSNVTNMGGMFGLTKVFNQDISKWDVSNVINMKDMFFNTKAFDQDIRCWDIHNVIYGKSTLPQSKQLVNHVEHPYESNDCSICSEDFRNTDVFITRCGHKFHGTCMIQYLKQHDNCPICQGVLFTTTN